MIESYIYWGYIGHSPTQHYSIACLYFTLYLVSGIGFHFVIFMEENDIGIYSEQCRYEKNEYLNSVDNLDDIGAMNIVPHCQIHMQKWHNHQWDITVHGHLDLFQRPTTWVCMYGFKWASGLMKYLAVAKHLVGFNMFHNILRKTTKLLKLIVWHFQARSPDTNICNQESCLITCINICIVYSIVCLHSTRVLRQPINLRQHNNYSTTSCYLLALG